jgi:hypothetical protein
VPVATSAEVVAVLPWPEQACALAAQRPTNGSAASAGCIDPAMAAAAISAPIMSFRIKLPIRAH